jgi:ubiquinone/menaquinone biosynthesis C-methylase UbiE
LGKLPSEGHEHYATINERERLLRSSHRLEAVRMTALFERLLPQPPATIYDIGGGAGIHALALAVKGYVVHLLDAVALHIEQAIAHPEGPRLRSAVAGDACSLPFEAQSAEVVLLLGPLYHLVERSDRLQALSEAKRVLKPGGLLLAASINRFVSVLEGIFKGANNDPLFLEMSYRDLATGQHRSPEGRSYFTTAYFHYPDELRKEAEDAGFEVQSLVGIEGPGWLLSDFNEAWADDRRREELVRLADAVETEPSLLGVSTHILAVARA